MAQSRLVGEQVAHVAGRELELVAVTTRGDVDPGSLSQIGGVGVFVAAVRDAVLDRRADLAVHSLKDLPTTPDPGLRLAAVPPREDPRDALVSRDAVTLAELPPGARVGTGSPRRRAQLLAVRPDLDVVDLRGNVDTRIARVLGDPASDRVADLDAVVLAVAGLTRLGRADVISERLDPLVMTPAPGQGALAVEVRSRLARPRADTASDEATGSVPGEAGHADAARTGAARADAVRPDAAQIDAVRADVARVEALADAALAEALAAIDDAPTRCAVTAERSLLAAIGAGCSAPVGALAHHELGVGEPTLHLHAVLATASGALVRRTRSANPDRAFELGQLLAAELLTEAAVAGGPSGGIRPPNTGSYL